VIFLKPHSSETVLANNRSHPATIFRDVPPTLPPRYARRWPQPITIISPTYKTPFRYFKGENDMPQKASDGIVHPRTVLEIVLQLQRQGTELAMRHLEQTEPELANYLFESLSDVYQNLSALGGSTSRTRRVYRQIELITLACIQSLRQSHYELWAGQMAGQMDGHMDGSCRRIVSPTPAEQPPEALP
jgi:hypothetical protein